MKDAKGHGSDGRGGKMSAAEERQNRSGIAWGRARAKWHDPSRPDYIHAAGAAHQAGVNTVGGQKQITIFHQDGEYAVPIPGNRGHSFTNDKADAEGTARQMHGQDIVIKHRAKSWGPEMD